MQSGRSTRSREGELLLGSKDWKGEDRKGVGKFQCMHTILFEQLTVRSDDHFSQEDRDLFGALMSATVFAK